MINNSDLLEIVKTSGMGQQATIDHGTAVYAWLVDSFHQVDMGEGVINTRNPVLHLTDADAEAQNAAEDSQVVYSGKIYTVIGPPVKTGMGITMLYLEAQA